MKTLIIALLILAQGTLAQASSGQWFREVRQAVVKYSDLQEVETGTLYANICGNLDGYHLLYDSKTGTHFGITMNTIPSMEGLDAGPTAKVGLLNLETCAVRTVQIPSNF